MQNSGRSQELLDSLQEIPAGFNCKTNKTPLTAVIPNQSEFCSGITHAAHEQLFPLALHQLTAEDSIRITQLFKYIYLTRVAKGLAGRRAKLRLQLQTLLTWLRSEGKPNLFLVFKCEPKFSACLLQRMLCSTNQRSDQKPFHPYGFNDRAVTRAASRSHNIMLCGMLWLTKPPAHLTLDSAARQLLGVEVHFLMETSLCHGPQDLLQLNYTISPCHCSCPVLISLDNYIFFRAEGN